MADLQFQARLKGYSLTTAEILYRMPDHPELLQLFLWQDYDIAPRFPQLGAFLIFWRDHLEGALYRVSVAHQRLVSPTEFRFIDGELVMH
ncbi:MAG: Usg family protein [Alphaproteobacteria bacterium]|jgi:uncharacterized protein Usg